MKQKISAWFKKTFSFDRFIKAFLLAVTIGLGAYLGQYFLNMHWLLALIVVTLILMLLAGNLLDVLYSFSVKKKSKK
jgi:predicted membrane-bound spermidine synthase